MWFKKPILALMFICCTTSNALSSPGKPHDFVYLNHVDPSIIQDLRYASAYNFIGHPIKGYHKPTCLLTRRAALQLKKIQAQLTARGYSLKVYDCYRPQQAVNEFVAWSQDDSIDRKAEFYPAINKKHLFKLDYISARSGHSRGSTVDLTIVKLPARPWVYNQKHAPVACDAPYSQRYHDNSLDLGTNFDCFSRLSHPDDQHVPHQAYLNRQFLRHWMVTYGFVPLTTEWWHFTLKNEPYPETYFDFPVK